MNGTEAYLAGKAIESNPHPAGTRARLEWLSAYLVAAFEWECA